MIQTEIRERALNMARIDTHSHAQTEWPSLREQVKRYEYFEFCQPQMDSKVTAAGVRKLYGIDPGPFIRPASDPAIFEKSEALHAKGATAAFEHALDTANITKQLAFSSHDPKNCPLFGLSPRIQCLAYIDPLIEGNPNAFCPDGQRDDFCYYDEIAKHFAQPLNTLDDYLEGIDAYIDTWRDNGVVGMKTAAAYTTGLDKGDPSRDDVKAAFAKKGGMSPGEVRDVINFAFRHALLACKRNGLPVVIHTGFQIWGHATLEQSRPMLLHNILVDKRYEDLTFVLLHGGNPYVGEITYLAGMFPNVIVDFTWISWMTRTRFRFALCDWIEVVPQDRFCWGSDSVTPESICGIDDITRTEIANVLEDLVERRILDEKLALGWLDDCYMNTPKRVFGL